MDIIKIIGLGLVSTFICIILKQYKPEFSMPVSLIAGIIMFMIISDKFSAIISLIKNISNKSRN